MRYDCVIIGAGMSGLAAGIRLAHFGKKVCILERHSRTGGLNSYYYRQGYEIDTGLHAMTNFVPRTGAKSSPLLKLLRQLRIGYDELSLREQCGAAISFPGVKLRFSNDISLLESEIASSFPAEKDAFARLVSFIAGYDGLDMNAPYVSARGRVGEFIRDPLLLEMLFCPLMYYGSAVEDDMDLAQFVIMFNSIFREGFCRPAGGVRRLLDILEKRFVESGGELKLKCEVRKIISTAGKVSGVETGGGELIECSSVLSCAGSIETFSLCGEKPANFAEIPAGQLGFVECILVLDRLPSEMGFNESIVFFNDSSKFSYRKPEDFVDFRSGVICCPNNYLRLPADHAKEPPMLRFTAQANHALWKALSGEACREMKEKVSAELASSGGVRSGIRDIQSHVLFKDIFTPSAITRYTGHMNGAVYGSPMKFKDGRTHLENLFLCGTDQGFLGITGSMLSGISIANKYLL